MRHFAIGLCLVAVACSSTAPPPASRVSLLYVQTASSGTFEPVSGSTNKYRLVLSDVSPRVIYFADRPNRIAGQVSTAEFLDKIGFGGPLDPNAAIEIAEGTPDSDLVIAALSKPAYDAQSRTLSYEVAVLETPRKSLAVYSDRMDRRLPAHFGAVALFIDDEPCPIACSRSFQCCPGQQCRGHAGASICGR
jgi:hypothetical protein